MLSGSACLKCSWPLSHDQKKALPAPDIMLILRKEERRRVEPATSVLSY